MKVIFYSVQTGLLGMLRKAVNCLRIVDGLHLSHPVQLGHMFHQTRILLSSLRCKSVSPPIITLPLLKQHGLAGLPNSQVY